MPIKPVLKQWIPLALILIIASAMAYVSAQQVVRQDANDPQIQAAEDIASALSSGQAPQNSLPAAKLDITRSLAPFGIIYDSSQKSIAYSGTINGILPAIPAGVLDYAKAHGEDRITWQPKPGVRIAAVIIYYQGAGANAASGYVLIGRSLREVENRIAGLGSLISLALLAGLIVSFGAVWILNIKRQG